MLWQVGLDPFGDNASDGSSPLTCSIIGALIGAAASLGSAAIGAGAAGKAAKAQEASAKINRQAAQNVGTWADTGYVEALDKALNELNFGEYRAQQPIQPYQYAGEQSLNQLGQALGLWGDFDPNAQIAATPGYQFRMDQGTQALNRAANAGGGLYSGSTGKALTEYGQGLAGQYWNDYLNQLAGVTGMGQQAASLGSGISSEFAGSRANALLGTQANRAATGLGALGAYTGANAQIGAAQAGGAINSANAWSGGLNNLAQLGMFGQGQGWFGGGASAAGKKF
jgi:hypothetical protein